MILFKRHNPYATLPSYQSEGAVGMDLCAALPEDSALAIAPGKRLVVPLGFSAEIPEDYWVKIESRSGLAVRQGIMVMTGVIDPDYRGEWRIVLYNAGDEYFYISGGDRIAQAVVCFRSPMCFVETEEELTYTSRGEGGFGSTGIAREADS